MSVYFIRKGPFVKIGMAGNVEKRLAQLRTGSPDDFEVLGTIPGDRETERALHARFDHLRHCREWFYLGKDLRSHILAATDPVEHAAAFLRAVLKPDPEGSASLRRLYGQYPEWCEARDITPLPAADLGKHLRTIVDAIGLEVEPEGKDMVVRGAAIAA